MDHHILARRTLKSLLCLPIDAFIEKVTRGKKRPNAKDEPGSIDPDMYDECHRVIESMIVNLGKKSDKPPFLNDDWDCANNTEQQQTAMEKNMYDYVRRTNGAQLGNAMNLLCLRLTHLRAKQSKSDKVFIPPNGSFECVMPRHHQPATSADCDMPMVFITRHKIKDIVPVEEYEHKFDTQLCLLCPSCAGYKLTRCQRGNRLVTK